VAAGIVLKELRRSGGEPTLVARPTNGRILRLDIPHYTLRGAAYAVTLSDQSYHRPQSITVRIQPGTTGIIQLTLDPRALPDGDYDLTLFEISMSVPPDTSATIFPFKLVTAGATR
jgi:hypothetical protein